jgi:hypothetical protein
MGVTKRELFEDYYIDEFSVIVEKYRDLKSPKDEEIVCGGAADFFGW